MKEQLRETLSEIGNPPLLPRRKRVLWGELLGVPFAFFLLHGYYGMPVLPSVLIALLFAVLIAAAFLWEIRAEKKNADLKNSITSGVYYEQEQWRERYRLYCEKHDFRPVRARSMKADLHRRYLRPSGIVMICFAMTMLIPAAFWRTGIAELNGCLLFGGLIFLVWGLVILLRTPVRRFLRGCGEQLPEIERSYLEGKMLTCKSNGICIGQTYTVLFDQTGITAVENRRITDVTRNVRQIRHFLNSLYAGIVTEHRICIRYQDAAGTDRTRVLRLNEFQTEMVYDRFAVHRKPTEFTEKTRHEVGC